MSDYRDTAEEIFAFNLEHTIDEEGVLLLCEILYLSPEGQLFIHNEHEGNIRLLDMFDAQDWLEQVNAPNEVYIRLGRRLAYERLPPTAQPRLMGADRGDLDATPRASAGVGTSPSAAPRRRPRRLCGDAYDDHGRVFAGACGEWINPNQLTRAVESLGERVGHPGMTVRSLRHFHASVALQTGQNIVVVSKRLGHSNVSITSDIYAHSLPGWQRQAVDAFAQAMEGN